MNDQQIKILIGVVAFLALFIKIPKINLPIWGWILKGIGDAINGSLNAKIADLSKQVTEVDKLLNEHIKSSEEEKMDASRRRMIRFTDEEKSGIKHSKDHWDEIARDRDIYIKYHTSHPEYSNSKGESSAEYFMNKYNSLTQNDCI